MKKLNKAVGIGFVIFFGVALISVFFVNLKDRHKEGYYRYEDTYYYHYDNHFFYYDDYEDEWSKYSGDFAEEVVDYYVDDDVPTDVDSFKSSQAYEKAYQDYIERQTYDDDDWDSGSTWDSSDSWDSGSTDWSSDW